MIARLRYELGFTLRLLRWYALDIARAVRELRDPAWCREHECDRKLCGPMHWRQS